MKRMVVLILVLVFNQTNVLAHQGYIAPDNLPSTAPGASFAKLTDAQCTEFKTKAIQQQKIITEQFISYEVVLENTSTTLNNISKLLKLENKRKLASQVDALLEKRISFNEQKAALNYALGELIEQPCTEYLVMDSFLVKSKESLLKLHEEKDGFEDMLKESILPELEKLLPL
jgi:hypothetical protein